MELNRNSSLTNVADALQGTWSRTYDRDRIVLEHGDMTIVRVNVFSPGPVVLPVVPTVNTPFTFWTKDSVQGGILIPGQRSIKVEATGILDYTCLTATKK